MVCSIFFSAQKTFVVRGELPAVEVFLMLDSEGSSAAPVRQQLDQIALRYLDTFGMQGSGQKYCYAPTNYCFASEPITALHLNAGNG